MALVYKIHPAIGVARVGNSPSEFYLGPDGPDELLAPQGGFKDSQCRLKRQAARFYVYEHDTVTGEAHEITGELSDISWSFTPLCDKQGFAQKIFQPATISGRLDAASFSMEVSMNGATPDVVPLGELRSDEQGRLILLGGFGKAEPIPGGGVVPPLTVPNRNYWYDDICEGPLLVSFTRDSVVHVLHAWALVAPPRSSPHESPVPSLYTRMIETAALQVGFTVLPALPGTPEAIDKAHLHFVSGAPGGDGIEASLTGVLTGYAVKFQPTDPTRLKDTFVSAFMTTDLPNPWQSDILSCSWAAWSGEGFSELEEARLHWHEQGLLVNVDGSEVLIEQCNAELNITLVTPELEFGTVPAGPGAMTGSALLPIVFEVVSSVDPVELVYDLLPSGPFSQAAPPPPAIAPAAGASQVVRFWVRYTTGAAEANGSVVIRHVGPDTTWTIPLHAIPGPRRFTATALVLDRSGSMLQGAGSGSPKHVLLRQAASAFLDLALPEDFIQLVRYDDTAQAIPLLDIDGVSASVPTLLDEGTRLALKTLVAGSDFDPDGSTSIGAGIGIGRSRLNSIPPDPISGLLPNKALLILTDGKENTPPSVHEQAADVDATTYAVGLGTPMNTSAPVLQALANNHGGYLLVTGEIDLENQFRLEKYFLQILAGINHAQVALDPSGVLRPGTQQTIPFSISDLDAGFEAILVSTSPAAIDFTLISPAGRVLAPFQVKPELGLGFGLSSRTAYYRVALPAELQPALLESAGTWRALLKLGRPQLEPPQAKAKQTGSPTTEPKLVAQRAALLGRALSSAWGSRPTAALQVPYTFLVHVYSSVSLRASLHQVSFEPGSSVLVQASLLDGGQLPLSQAEVKVDITRPTGVGVVTLELRPSEQEPGHYQAEFVASGPGVYSLRVRARARSSEQRLLTREQTLTAAVWYGGDADAARASGASAAGDLQSLTCELLPCLLEGGVLSKELRERLHGLGIDWERLRACLERHCGEARGGAELARRLERAMTPRRPQG